MEFEITETVQAMENGEVETLGKVEEPSCQRINIQIFKMGDLKRSLEYIKATCILPLIKKTDFDTIEQLMICYRTILASFETLIIGQDVISSLEAHKV